MITNFNLKKGILKRVINNGMTSSSWHFNQFLYVRFFDRMTGFINFEADNDDGDVIIYDCDPEAQTVRDSEFIDDETQIDDNIKIIIPLPMYVVVSWMQCRIPFLNQIAVNISSSMQ